MYVFPSTYLLRTSVLFFTLSVYEGVPKITGIIFLKWFIRFCTITTPVSFKVLSFWLNTLDTEGGQK